MIDVAMVASKMNSVYGVVVLQSVRKPLTLNQRKPIIAEIHMRSLGILTEELSNRICSTCVLPQPIIGVVQHHQSVILRQLLEGGTSLSSIQLVLR